MVQIITNKDTVVVYDNNIKIDKPLPIIEKLMKESKSDVVCECFDIGSIQF